VFGFVLRPFGDFIRALNQDAVRPLEETERETLGAVRAIEEATDSIERHVEVIETLATSVGPLTDSVDRLNATLHDIVAVLAPVAGAEDEVRSAEQEVERAAHLFRFRHHDPPPEPGQGSTHG
jgi:methyl-accepting chemotaxis protein